LGSLLRKNGTRLSEGLATGSKQLREGTFLEPANSRRVQQNSGQKLETKGGGATTDSGVSRLLADETMEAKRMRTFEHTQERTGD
jgi:hypothetical protein